MPYGVGMSTMIQVKGASEVLKERLSASALRNNRSLNQEALERLERSFEIEDMMTSRRDQKWIEEALAGEFRAGSIKRLQDIAKAARASVP